MKELINDININIWINANAGSGKTTILVDKFISLISNNIPLNDILCITYTNIAAKEMKTRILKKIKDDYPNIYLNESELNVSTIHSFCQNLLMESNIINKDVKIIEKNIIQNITSKILELLQNNSELHNEIIILSGQFNLYFFYKLINFCIENANKINSFVKNENNLINLLPDEVKNLFDYDIQKIEDNLIKKLKNINKNEIYNTIAEIPRLKIDFIGDLYSINSYKKILLTLVNQPRKINFSKLKNQNIANIFYEIQNFLILKDKYKQANNSLIVIKIVKFIIDEYFKIKKRDNIISYEDMLYNAFETISNKKYNKIKYLLLDEAQDTNPLSWEIIKKITNNSRIFVVGDQKQSIYSFQDAELQNFFLNKEYFKRESKKNNIEFHELDLQTSYRSTQKILDFVDILCEKYDEAFKENNEEKIKHISSIKDNNISNISLNNINLSKLDDEINEDFKYNWIKINEKKIKQYQNISNQIDNIAKYILEIYKKEPSKTIAVLFTKPSTQDYLIFDIIKYIEMHDISIEIYGKMIKNDIYFLDILSLFQFIILQNDNLNLACLLKSKFFNLLDEEIEFLIKDNDDNLFNNLINYNGLNNKINIAKSKINELLLISENGINELLKSLINLTKGSNKIYYYYLQVIEKMSYDFKNNFDYRGFLQFIDEINIEDYIIKNNEENSIFFGTIHSVKGMEFDKVILIDLNESINSNHFNPILFIDNKLWLKQSFDKDFIFMKELKDKQEKMEYLEQLRLLYVAITRAKFDFIYFGNKDKNQFKSILDNCLNGK